MLAVQISHPAATHRVTFYACSARSAKEVTMKFLNYFKESIKSSSAELNNIKTLSISGLLIAVVVVIGFFGSIQLSESIKIELTATPYAISGWLFGPIVGGIVGALSDIAKFIVKPTGSFTPGLTICEFLSCFIYGLVLYKKPINPFRIIAAKVFVMVFINLVLKTLFLSFLMGTPYFSILPMRIIKECILLPIDCILIYSVSSVLCKSALFRKRLI